MCPSCAQEAPKRPQEGPKRFQEASKRWFWEILAFILADVWLFLAMLFNHCLSARDERLGWLRNRLIFHFLFFKCCKKMVVLKVRNQYKINENPIKNVSHISKFHPESVFHQLFAAWFPVDRGSVDEGTPPSLFQCPISKFHFECFFRNPISINSLRLDSLWIAEALMKVPPLRFDLQILFHNPILKSYLF